MLDLSPLLFYEQLAERISEGGSVTTFEIENFAALQQAVPTVEELSSYIFECVAIASERIPLAIRTERQRGHHFVAQELTKHMTDYAAERLTYETTERLMSEGFRALDGTIFRDINRPPTKVFNLTRANQQR